MNNLYLIEFYTNDPLTGTPGWDINFAWVFAADKAAARARLVAEQGARFDCVITSEQQASITPLAGNFRVNTPDANLFIYGPSGWAVGDRVKVLTAAKGRASGTVRGFRPGSLVEVELRSGKVFAFHSSRVHPIL